MFNWGVNLRDQEEFCSTDVVLDPKADSKGTAAGQWHPVGKWHVDTVNPSYDPIGHAEVDSIIPKVLDADRGWLSCNSID
jgi:hypothetical protein